MEIEIKAKVKDLRIVRKKLIKLGAKSLKKVHQIDTYYSLYKRPLNKMKGAIVRLRHNKNKNQTFFEYDWAVNNLAAYETEVSVGNVNSMKKILKLMKAKVEVVIDKKREYFKKGKLEIVLDEVKGLGKFIEVEIQGRDTKINRHKLFTFLFSLGIKKKDFIMGPRYPSMLLRKKGRRYYYF